MYEGIIKTLVRFFAIITNYDDERVKQDSFNLVKSYLHENLDLDLVDLYQETYFHFIDYYNHKKRDILYKAEDNTKIINAKHLRHICKKIVAEYDLNTRVMIVAQLLNFVRIDQNDRSYGIGCTDQIAKGLKIDLEEYLSLFNFSLGSVETVKDKSILFVVNGKEHYNDPKIKHLYRSGMNVELEIIRIISTNALYFKYHGDRNLYLNGHRLAQHRLYNFPQGGILKTSRITPIYYTSIMSRFIQTKGDPMIVYNVENIEYRFSKKNIGLHPISFQERSGDLVGIIGGSGVGKTTLLNVLNGKLKPDKGTISINGYNIHDEQNEAKLKGLIGYVPQDDLLLEELTVYKNLEYNARFCFGKMSEENIQSKIKQTLIDFDLVEARDLVVGNPMRKILSGGQRKRLNIALELMREPAILFADEPTSGLSSADSEKIMHLLKRQCLKGKLVFANVHQPASELYKMFDRIIILDQGGRVVFFGNPMDAITYFKTEANYINPDQSECLTCGNIKTDQPLQILEARMVDPFGRTIRKRKRSAEDWYKTYKNKIESGVVDFMNSNPLKGEKLPEVLFKVPDWFSQLKLFLNRDMEKKRSNRQYMSIALLEAPLLALILGFIAKYSETSEYLLRYNDNLPAYLFMSVVVVLFIGLSISSEEIFKDRKILQREEFLDLSRGAYLTSKILLLFGISAFQVLSFVLIGHYILEIKELTFSTWAILFSTACFANVLGLNLSSGLNSAVAIYITVPFLLVPQMLLSGVVVDFNKMHPSLSSYHQTPIIGDIMTSRWAYEAQAVNFIKNNAYREDIFPIEQIKSNLRFKTYYYIPELHKYFNSYLTLEEQGDIEKSRILLPLLHKSFDSIEREYTGTGELNAAIDSLESGNLSFQQINILEQFLDESKQRYQTKFDSASLTLDKTFEKYEASVGGREALLERRNKYTNKKLNDFVMDKYSDHKVYIKNNQILQGDEPIFRPPSQENGRAHFYASYKIIKGVKIDTVIFNISIIWLFISLLMIMLYFDVLRKSLTFIHHWHLRQQVRLTQNIIAATDVFSPKSQTDPLNK